MTPGGQLTRATTSPPSSVRPHSPCPVMFEGQGSLGIHLSALSDSTAWCLGWDLGALPLPRIPGTPFRSRTLRCA